MLNRTGILCITLMVTFFVSIGTGMALAAPTPSKGGGVGDGELHVFTDQLRTNEAPTNQPDKYLVLPNHIYYFTITNITEYNVGDATDLWATYNDHEDLIDTFSLEQGGTIDFTWTIPTVPEETEIKYKYGISLTGPDPSWRFAKRTTNGVGITLVIPDVPFGILGSAMVLFSAYGLKAFSTKKKRQHEPYLASR